MFAARQIFLGARNAPTAKDYVQDGLAVLWDGIENEALGQPHNPNATTWKDIVTAGASAWDMTVPASWSGGNSLYFDGTWTAVATKTQRTELTIEVVSSGYPDSDRSLCAGWTMAGEGKRPSFNFRTNLFRVYLKSDTFDPSLPTASDAKSIAVTFGSASTSVYCGGRLYKTENKVLPSGETHNRFRLCGYGDANDASSTTTRNLYKGNIYRCAIYNRALTAAEIAANYAIDKERFNLP